MKPGVSAEVFELIRGVVLACLLPAAAQAMTFEFGSHCSDGQCVPAVYARGPLDLESANRFEKTVGNAPPGLLVVMESRGGSLIGGLKFGQLIRQKGYNTRVEDTCLSACVYAFLGGVQRRVTEEARFGVHQFRTNDNAVDVAGAQRIGALLGKYFDAMGIDRKLLDIAQVTPHEKTAVLTREQLLAFKVDNFESPLPRWKLDAAPEGDLIAMNSRMLPGRPEMLTVGIVRSGANMRLLVMLRGGPAVQVASVPNMKAVLRFEDQRIPLEVVVPWAAIKEGRQIWFDLPATAQRALLGVGEQTGFELEAAWFQEAEASSIKVGAGGLRNALNALRKYGEVGR